MAELLIKAIDATHSDPEKDLEGYEIDAIRRLTIRGCVRACNQRIGNRTPRKLGASCGCCDRGGGR